MFVKFTEDGAFTNATHLRRNDISWTFNSMADLIAHRLIKSEGFSEKYLGQTPGLSNTRAAWDALLPPVGRAASSHAKKRFSNSQQICLWTADGSGLYNPRNAITLLNLALLRARENQRRAISLGSANRPQSPLVSSGEVQAALGELARRRIEDTVQNEFPSVAPLINMLVGGPNEYKTRKDLLDRLGLDRDGAKAEDALNSLVMSGLIGQKPGVAYYIPRLYRPALRSKSRGGRVGDPG